MIGIFYMLITGLITCLYPCKYTFKLLFQSIQYNGCFAIKIAQWICARNDNNTNKYLEFDSIFSHNNAHSHKYTEYVFKNEISQNLDEVYTDIKLINSGSVAQVYKCTSIDTNEDVILKVKHPNIDTNVYSLWNLVKIMIKISKLFGIFKFMKILKYTESDNLLKTFLDQTDFYNEANRMKYFYEYYKDNDYVIIPKLHYVTDNIIAMSYEESLNINDIEDSMYKYQCVMLLCIVMKDQIFNSSVVHCDMHTGNWGIKNDSIVLYDFGYTLYQTEELKDRHSKWMILYERNSKNELIKHMMDNFIINNDKTLIPPSSTQLDKVFNMNDNINFIIDYCELHDVILDYTALEMMIAFNCFEKICISNLNHYYEINDNNIDNHWKFFHNSRKEYYIYSKKFGFNKLSEFYKESEDYDSFASISTLDVESFYNDT